MRRSAVLAVATAAGVALTLGVGVAPASAHVCALPVEVPVGQTATIDVGVTVEGTAVPDVEITIPATLRLDRADPEPGWKLTRAGSTVRYRGGPIATFTCEYFSFGVTATARGSFGIPVVQRAAGGNVVARSLPDPGNATDRMLGQIVYAGVKPPAAPGSNGPSKAMIAGIALVGLGVVMVVALGFRARRERRLVAAADGEGDISPDTSPDRDAELRERLERFKKRAPRPPRPD